MSTWSKDGGWQTAATGPTGPSGPAPIPATGATEVAGAAGTWTPAGADPAADLAAMSAVPIVASPLTAWTTGSHMVLGDASQAHWNAGWVAGAAP